MLRHQTIDSWYDTHASEKTIDLNYCFGTEVFEPLELKKRGGSEFFVMAELIRNYLHRHCKTFLNHAKGDRFGLQLCRFQRSPVDESQHDCAISFSAVHPQTKEIQFWDEPKFGSLSINLEEARVQSDLDRCHPLTCSGDPSVKVTFADCFTEPFRKHILPKELDQTYLDFSMGEIASYFLHWILLRIFGLPKENKGFLEVFRTWQEGRVADKPAPDPVIQRLFNTPVILPFDPSLAKSTIGDTPFRSDTLCTFNQPTSFKEVLAAIELQYDRSGSHSVLLSAAQFLLREFSEGGHSASRGFATLPMYKDLGWLATKALAKLSPSKPGFRSKRTIRQILSETIASMVNHYFDLTKSWPDPGVFNKALEKHNKMSVYPFKHILTNWPRGGPQVSQYLILPLWEATIGEEVRPVIFAHVFRATDRQRDTYDYARKLQRWLLPCGPLLATKYEPERRENEIYQEKMITGGFMAHELNKLLHKHYAGVRQQLYDSQDSNAPKWVHAWDHISATAQLAYLSAKSFLSPDSSSKLCREFIGPLIELHQSQRLLPTVWAVAKAIYESNKLDECSSDAHGAPVIEQLESYKPKSGVVEDHEFASLFLLLGELLRNFCHHSYSPREGKKGQFQVELNQNRLIISLEDWRPSIPNSNTINSMKNFLQYNGIGDIESDWLVTWKHFQTRIWLSLSGQGMQFDKGERQ